MCTINVPFIIVAILLSLALTLTLASPIGNPLILGGEVAKPGQFPYQASIRVFLFQHICGASIISENYVLTAAHCNSPNQFPASYFVSVGAHSRYGGHIHRVKRRVIHEDYDASHRLNDIALIEMSSPIKFNELVAPIPLGRDFIDSGVEAVASGWGITGPDSDRYLRFAALTTLSNDECRERFKHKIDDFIHDFNVLCAYSGQQGKGVGNGDSGGPLVSNHTLIGVAVFATEVEAIGFPDGFTRVGTYVDWIEKTTGAL